MRWFEVAVWLSGAVSVAGALGSLACASLFCARLHIPLAMADARPVVILPATGMLPGFDALLAALSVQSLPPRRLIVSLESRNDPAYRRVCTLATRYPELRLEIVVAELSDRRGQKNTNTLAALATLDADDRFIVLLDADMRPQPWFLSALVEPLACGRADVVNGHRWLVPQRVSPISSLVATIDRRLGVLPRYQFARIVCGGSIAMTRHAMHALELPRILDRQLCEDAPIGSRIAETSLRFLSRRAVRVPTPLDASSRALWAFARRQAKLIHVYRPGLWWYGALVANSDLVARVVLLVAMAASRPLRWVALAILLAIATLDCAAAELRLAISRKVGVSDAACFRLSQYLAVWSVLPYPAFYAALAWASLVASPIRWAHIRYDVDGHGNVTGMQRYPYA